MTSTSEYEQQSQAFSQSYQLAQTGDAEAQYQTGFYYAQGIGVAQNYRSAGFYWLNAAKQSHPAAQTYLGLLFEQGLGYQQDLNKAIHCYQTASELGFTEAKVRLAMLYLTGKGLAQDSKKAILLFIQAAEQGEAVAQYNLGIAYERGLGGLKHNDDLAHFWYQQAAYQNHPQAMARLAADKFAQKPTPNTTPTSTMPTSTMPENYRVGDNLAHQAASDTTPDFTIDDVFTPQSQPINFDDDDVPVHPDSDTIFARGVAIIQADLKRAFNFFEQAALLGHAKAEYNMGLAFLYGLGGNHVCTETALEWLEKSANQSFRPAYLALGWLYQGGNPYLNDSSDDIGETIIVDCDNAISQYEMASELGHAQAQYFLANIYPSGNGVAADADKASAWLKQSGKQGYAAALTKLRPSVPETADDHHT